MFFAPPPPRLLLQAQGLPHGLLFLLSPILFCQKTKDGGYGVTNLNKEPSLAPQIRPHYSLVSKFPKFFRAPA